MTDPHSTELAWMGDRRASIPKVEYQESDFGKVAELTAEQVLKIASSITSGKIYDLDSGRWPGMPLFGGHPAFQITTYRTATGQDIAGDFDEWRGINDVHMGFTTELISGTAHTGTHIDALCHTTCGPDNEWFGGHKSKEALGDFGPTRAEASSIAPIVSRGILVDVAGFRKIDALPAGEVISLKEFKEVLEHQSIEVLVGDVVLVHTGYMKFWTQGVDTVSKFKGAGISLEVADYLAERGAVVVGADTETVEADPSPDPRNPHPVHIRLMIEKGVHLLELVYLSDLARDHVYQFMFVCLPLRIKGATGSMVRPIAIC
jgi:kynurenine formamidase